LKENDGTNIHFNTANYSNQVRNQNGVSLNANCNNPIKLPKIDEATNILFSKLNNRC